MEKIARPEKRIMQSLEVRLLQKLFPDRLTDIGVAVTQIIAEDTAQRAERKATRASSIRASEGGAIPVDESVRQSGR